MTKNNRIAFLNDVLLNSLSFFIYILGQQLLFMPLMGKWLTEGIYANFIIFISVFAILSNSLGNELGIVSQIIEQKVNFQKILHFIAFISFCVTVIILYYLNFNFLDTVFLSLSVFLANYRLFYSGYFRKNSLFRNVLVINILYLIGICFGLAVYRLTYLIWSPLLLAELISLIYIFCYQNKLEEDNIPISKENVKTFLNFSLISFLNNLITYLDKIIIYPILGPTAVSIYYSTASMSKVVNLVTNPLHGVLLNWIKNDGNRNNIIKKFIVATMPIIVISSIISIPITYFAMKLLYSQFLPQGNQLIVPVSLALGISIGTSLLKSVLLKFIDSKIVLRIFIFYFLSFVILAYVSSNLFGLVGFSYSVFISKCILLIGFISPLIKLKEAKG
ncbi:TPA: hypothetical protein TY884_000890 [Streptococcus suis]|uniref:hypothetical protein n=1 Tax=Streptococcus suis TaxID=1307 RepID=UPI000942F4F5|nr:hypothetical protein [Streptococcus suis]WNF60457.1 hypothetical protein RJW50_03255 [Streptococcus suis]HEL1699274.1 hypothetical protein [Streptococcus suis]HEL1763796.1 hypothetical protein [Streptococcus suis]HEL1792131.1 hypothetical protein [Streptococcus suis]HEL1826490.1 hypothetical protein [Streptococcus suis]